MQVNVHHPKLDQIVTLNTDTDSRQFHTIDLVDNSSGKIVLFIDSGWSEWDALVEAVAAYRAEAGQQLSA